MPIPRTATFAGAMIGNHAESGAALVFSVPKGLSVEKDGKVQRDSESRTLKYRGKQ
jgi:hypothetical protein